MSFFQVSAAHLRKKAEELKGLNTRFKTSVESLNTTEQSLNSMWEGEANEAFHKCFLRDKGRMDSFHAAIARETWCASSRWDTASISENKRTINNLELWIRIK